MNGGNLVARGGIVRNDCPEGFQRRGMTGIRPQKLSVISFLLVFSFKLINTLNTLLNIFLNAPGPYMLVVKFLGISNTNYLVFMPDFIRFYVSSKNFKHISRFHPLYRQYKSKSI